MKTGTVSMSDWMRFSAEKSLLAACLTVRTLSSVDTATNYNHDDLQLVRSLTLRSDCVTNKQRFTDSHQHSKLSLF